MLADAQAAILHRSHPAHLSLAVGHNFWRKGHVYSVNLGVGNDLLKALEIRRTVKYFCTSRMALHVAHRPFGPSSRQIARAFSSRRPGLKNDHGSPNYLDRPNQENQYWSPSTQAPSLSLYRSLAGISPEVPRVSPGPEEAGTFGLGEYPCVERDQIQHRGRRDQRWEARFSGELRRAGVCSPVLRHTEGQDCVFDSMVGHRCNLRQ